MTTPTHQLLYQNGTWKDVTESEVREYLARPIYPLPPEAVDAILRECATGREVKYAPDWWCKVRRYREPVQYIERPRQRCKRCGAFEGDAMFTTLAGSGICDDCV